MPTFNQLVRKGREDAKKPKSSCSFARLQHAYQAADRSCCSSEERRLHEGVHKDPEEAELCFEKDRKSQTDQRYRSYFVYSGYRSQLAGTQRCAYPRREESRTFLVCVITSFAVRSIRRALQREISPVPSTAQSAKRRSNSPARCRRSVKTLFMKGILRG